MADFGKGYEPVPGFMEKHCRTLTMFHDPKAYKAEVHGPGLLTGVSKFGKRIYYESKSFFVNVLTCYYELLHTSPTQLLSNTFSAAL